MSLNASHFFFAERGPTSVFKFRVADDPAVYVWLEYGEGRGALFTTAANGPYRVEDPLEPAGFASLDDLLAARGTSRRQWVRDLLAQYGERLGWTYP